MSKGKKSRMTNDRFKQLNDLGFIWSSTLAEKAKARMASIDAKVADVSSKAQSDKPAENSKDDSKKAAEGGKPPAEKSQEDATNDKAKKGDAADTQGEDATKQKAPAGAVKEEGAEATATVEV